VNAPIDGDGSALIVAAREGRVDIVRLLLDRGADPNLGVQGDGSAIIVAAREGHIPVVELLLERGAYVDQVVDGDENALITASREGELDMVKLLVSRGADVNTRVLVRRSTVTQTETEVYDNLGQRRVLPVRRLQTRDEWRSALSMARQGGHEAVVAYLISVGAQE
jgi:ankyrin repeat protein